MKICIVGAGAIGSALAARLATGGHEIAIIARGARRASLQQHGLVVVENGQTLQSRPALIGADALASQDLVITAVKSHSLPGLLPTLASAMGSQTRLIPAVNGMPFWYFQGEGGPSDGRPVASVDPGGRLARLLPARRIIGCVVYSRATMLGTNKTVIDGRQDLRIGGIDGANHDDIARELTATGIAVKIEPDIRQAVWLKLIRNCATNLISALTRTTLGEIGQDSDLSDVMRAIASEVAALSARMGHPATIRPGEMEADLHRAASFKTSMLQDLEAGRPLETAAIADATLEIADLVGQPMPVLRTTATLLRRTLKSTDQANSRASALHTS